MAQVRHKINVAGSKIISSRAQALESNSEATAALASHRYKEGDSLLSKLFSTSVGNAEKHR